MIRKKQGLSRRTFIQSASMASAALLLLPGCSVSPSKNIGLQLYTLRKIMNEKNLHGTLEKIAAIGYTELEIFGLDLTTKLWGLEPAAFQKLLRANNLKAPASHIYFESFLIKNDIEGFKRIADAALLAGNEFLVLAWLEEQYRTTPAHYHAITKKLNEAAVIANKMGLQMVYHNHDFEFEDLGSGQKGYDIILAETDPQLVKLELDIYWCSKAGVDAINLFKKYPGRFPLWHVKDMDATTKDFTEVGSGVIDYKSIFQHAHTAGLQHFFIEQDEIKGAELASITQSYAYVKKNILPVL